MSKKRRYACWKCGKAMKGKATHCKKCRKGAPRAVKTQTAMLVKSFGHAPRPVPVAVAKAAAPRCPNPACGAKAGRNANCCTRCGSALGFAGQLRAEKAARRTQLQIVQSPAWWLQRAAAQSDPAAREYCRAEAAKALGARGQQDASTAAMIVKASGAPTVREAWLRESDPHMREVLWQALTGKGGRSA